MDEPPPAPPLVFHWPPPPEFNASNQYDLQPDLLPYFLSDVQNCIATVVTYERRLAPMHFIYSKEVEEGNAEGNPDTDDDFLAKFFSLTYSHDTFTEQQVREHVHFQYTHRNCSLRTEEHRLLPIITSWLTPRANNRLSSFNNRYRVDYAPKHHDASHRKQVLHFVLVSILSRKQVE